MSDQPYRPPDPPVVPYLSVSRGHEALEWYVRAFAATEDARYDMEDGRLGHVKLTLDNGGVVYVADDFPEMFDMVGVRPPEVVKNTTMTVCLAVEDVDRWMDRAAGEGAEIIRPAQDEFFGRHGKLRDPFGHVWSVTGPKAP